MKILPFNPTTPELTTIIVLLYSCGLFPRCRVMVDMLLLHPEPFSYHHTVSIFSYYLNVLQEHNFSAYIVLNCFDALDHVFVFF